MMLISEKSWDILWNTHHSYLLVHIFHQNIAAKIGNDMMIVLLCLHEDIFLSMIELQIPEEST